MASKKKSTSGVQPVQQHSPLIKLLLGLYHAGVPTMIWSSPGCGKTATVKQLGEILKVPTIIRSGNKSDPSDFAGIPYLEDVGGRKEMKYSVPTHVKALEKCRNGIVFFDEINTCPMSIQVALLSIIQDCNYGEFSIPETTFRVAAGNYTDTAGNKQMSTALMNRLVHLFVEPDSARWCEGFVSGFQNYERPIINNQDERERKLLQYRLATCDFLKQNPDFHNMTPTTIVKKTDVAFPTGRTWDMATTIMATLDQNDSDYLLEILCGVVGVAAAPLFLSFCHDYEGLGIDLTTFVGREDSFRLPDPEEHDQVNKIMSSMAYYFKLDPKKYLKLWATVINVIYNKNGKYGNYHGYPTLIMKFLRGHIDILIERGIIKPKELKGNGVDLSNMIEGYDDLSPYINW